MKNISIIRIAILTLLLSMAGRGMSIRAAGLLTLDEVIRLAQQKSYDAQVARFTFLGKYWTYRSFRAELLPSINLSGNLMNFNRSMVEARNYENGQISYVENNSLTNSLTLSIDQNVPLLGGTFSLQSYLYRLDQFSYDQRTYNSQPLRLRYTQPLRTYNELKWKKKTEPLEYENAQKAYLESMQNITMQVTTLFFNVLSAQSDYKQSVALQNDRERLFRIAQKRLELGTIEKSEILQLELSLLNARVAVKKNKISLDDCLFNLFTYMQITDYEGVELIPPYQIPEVTIGMDRVVDKAMQNSSHFLQQKLNLLTSQQALARAKSNKGIQVELSSEIAFNKTADHFSDAYSGLKDNEVIGLTLSMPLFDWGVSKGKVKVAQANLEVVKTQIQQANMEFMQEIKRKVLQFSNQADQCRDAERAQNIAEERYAITQKRFENGAISVTELNTAQQELESARAQYISQLETFWGDYYTLQKITLYDFINNKDITVDFKELLR